MRQKIKASKVIHRKDIIIKTAVNSEYVQKERAGVGL